MATRTPLASVPMMAPHTPFAAPLRGLHALTLFGAVLAAVADTAFAQAVPELSPRQVIQLAAPTAGEKIPVVSGVALGPGGNLLATVGDDHLTRLWDARKARSSNA